MKEKRLILIVTAVLVAVVVAVVGFNLAKNVCYEFVGEYELDNIDVYERGDYKQGVFSLWNDEQMACYGISGLDFVNCTYIVSHNAPLDNIKTVRTGVASFVGDEGIKDKITVVSAKKNYEEFFENKIYLYKVNKPYIVTEDEYEMKYF